MGGWRYILLIVLACNGVDGGAFETRRAKDSRPPLEPEVQGLVGIVAVFIILANSMLCLFIVRDPGLWSYVSKPCCGCRPIFLTPNSPESEQGDVFHGDR